MPAGSVARSTSIGVRPSASVARHLRGQVHHVAVALERHELVDVAGAELDDPPDVVAGQVDQHDVLGALLGVLEQLGGELAVVLVGAAAEPRAGDRTRDHPALEQLHHRLGRAADQRQLVLTHVVHVRARVDPAQHPVHVERVGVDLDVEALGQHDLEDVARQDVLLGRARRRAGTRPPASTTTTAGTSPAPGASTSGSSIGRRAVGGHLLDARRARAS